MAPNSSAGRELAERLLASGGRAPAAEHEDEATLAAAARVGHHLAVELSRWFGPYGYRTLLARALAQSRAEHPALAAVEVGAAASPHLDGLADAARDHGARAVRAGVLAVLATLIGLLGRLIGEDLAATFVDRTILAMAPDTVDGAAVDASSSPPPESSP